MGTKIGFEAKGVNGGNVRFDRVQWRATDWLIGDHMTTTTSQYSVYCGNTIGFGKGLTFFDLTFNIATIPTGDILLKCS